MKSESLDPRLEKLLELEPNWDSYNSDRIDRGAAEIADALLQIMANPPAVIPTSDGGISLEWHLRDSEFAITVPNSKTSDPLTIYCYDDIWINEWEAVAHKTDPFRTVKP